MSYTNECEPSPYLHSPAKRWLDFTIASGALTASSPLWPVVYTVNRLHHENTLCHLSRVGFGNRIFKIHKFETMYAGADRDPMADKQSMLCGPEREDDDFRVHPFYKTIHFRSIGLNEIPQFINVLNGEMSVVGPRPDTKSCRDLLKDKFPVLYPEWEYCVSCAKPGFSVLPRIQRSLDSDTDWPEKAKLDIEYVYNASFWRDLVVIADTVLFVGQTAYNGFFNYFNKVAST